MYTFYLVERQNDMRLLEIKTYGHKCIHFRDKKN